MDIDRRKFDEYGGFSPVLIVLSDALPAAAFHPDFLEETYEKLRWDEEMRRFYESDS